MKAIILAVLLAALCLSLADGSERAAANEPPLEPAPLTPPPETPPPGLPLPTPWPPPVAPPPAWQITTGPQAAPPTRRRVPWDCSDWAALTHEDRTTAILETLAVNRGQTLYCGIDQSDAFTKAETWEAGRDRNERDDTVYWGENGSFRGFTAAQEGWLTDGESGLTGMSIQSIFEFPQEERRRRNRRGTRQTREPVEIGWLLPSQATVQPNNPVLVERAEAHPERQYYGEGRSNGFGADWWVSITSNARQADLDAVTGKTRAKALAAIEKILRPQWEVKGLALCQELGPTWSPPWNNLEGLRVEGVWHTEIPVHQVGAVWQLNKDPGIDTPSILRVQCSRPSQ